MISVVRSASVLLAAVVLIGCCLANGEPVDVVVKKHSVVGLVTPACVGVWVSVLEWLLRTWEVLWGYLCACQLAHVHACVCSVLPPATTVVMLTALDGAPTRERGAGWQARLCVRPLSPVTLTADLYV